MLYKRQYTTADERTNFITSNASLILVEEQNLIEGNFLIFSDEPLPPSAVYITVSEESQNILAEQNLILMDALATTFEEILALRAIMEGGTT